MEQYHILKSGHSDINDNMSVVKTLVEEATLSNEEGILNDPISMEEVNTTFNTCTGAPGPDGFHSKLIDKADRSSYGKLSKIYI